MGEPSDPRNTPGRENRLARSGSPYLLQHRFNPVDWYQWGPEAFDEARRREVPIFLSIGYSTCYWCHVMERESFESEAIAAIMNAEFVCVKVDREERPDVDDIYMAAVQAFRGQGGWPMSVFLEPRTLKPFWAGTYFPAEPKFAGMPTFPQVLKAIAQAWRDQRDEIIEQSGKLADAVRERVAEAGRPVQVGAQQVKEAVAGLLQLHDDVHGGFGGAPKFPQPVYLELLLETRLSADEATRRAIDAAVRTTLTAMALGGIFDQVGGGFHRYSVDAQWVVPHFEKMLYDNAQLAAVYARAAKLYGDDLYRRIAVRTLEYVLREMTHESGGFFSAQDAEVNHREGQNYLWTLPQLEEVLSGEDARVAARVYAVDAGPNFRDPHHPGDGPSNVLRWADAPASSAAALGLSELELLAQVDSINNRLYEARCRRDQPAIDDKVISGWNGLMIAAMAEAGTLLDRPDFVNAAENAATFVLSRLRVPDGSLLRSIRPAQGRDSAGCAGGVLEDYACMVQACAALHRAESGGQGRWLGEARLLAAAIDRRFGDAESGGFFDTLADQPDLFVRARTPYDGAMPSGISSAVNAFIDLFVISGDRVHFERAIHAVRSVSAALAAAPLGLAGSTRALLRMLRLEAGAVYAAFENDPPAKSAPGPDFTPVEVHAAVERITLRENEPAGLSLRVRIAEGYHINAADVGEGPDAADLVRFRVHIVNGRGVNAYADYPAGAPYGVDGRLRVYAGELELVVALEREGAWEGTPLIALTYQACTEDSCLEPRTVELDVALDAAD